MFCSCVHPQVMFDQSNNIPEVICRTPTKIEWSYVSVMATKENSEKIQEFVEGGERKDTCLLSRDTCLKRKDNYLKKRQSPLHLQRE